MESVECAQAQAVLFILSTSTYNLSLKPANFCFYSQSFSDSSYRIKQIWFVFVFIASPFQIPATESNKCEMLHGPGVRVWSVHFGGSGAGWSLVFCDIKWEGSDRYQKRNLGDAAVKRSKPFQISSSSPKFLFQDYARYDSLFFLF